MSDITVKSIGTLIDELITTNIKCFMQQEVVHTSDDTLELAAAAKATQSLNARRCALIRALDSLLNSNGMTLTEKTYV